MGWAGVLSSGFSPLQHRINACIIFTKQSLVLPFSPIPPNAGILYHKKPDKTI